ncbi:RNA-binding protein [Dendronalium sp. ChiSLP03b]|uniref:RNA recognition motif domain-containing protein n=1 Tax=Dendronalium sp. ChiSLP03b TaxID=3075381 RepID=UPI002AD206B8|nr:RNA-binding protein [Dendronalium sp. ChiSLP03b]MDZ8207970.1 RNA-binding protein [Dendronalium sp. ChiSLP03b]
MSLYVSNFSGQIKENELNQAFSEYGSVKRVQLSINQETGEESGFASVEMETDAEEASAIKALLGSKWIVRRLKVNKAINGLDTSSSS